ncbi:hypothetical protein [Siphonobacter sp. SORGH_AS_0500]|uniref:hypothetical protein n=1 Tax=Siphonobacter sp. SORGH_AS_0500 TaxID=1864824 RepID=UPI00285D78BA|nr:hypothetical protein [Siphonobacter sp. SORGH_AS_0500]MDR6195325.1 hypothetical protein [Siphonobacter sp. SORGH_AS_0500]
MKQFLLSAGLMLATVSAYAQLGVGTSTPKAQLDVTASNPSTPSNTDGLLIPRVSAFPATNPTAEQNGMMVFLTTASGNKLPGFYYWNESSKAWKSIYSSSETLKFYYPFSTQSLGENKALSIYNSSTATLSTKPRFGLTVLGEITPHQISNGTTITGAVLTLVRGAVNNPTITYPCYAYAAIYRQTYGGREPIGILEFEISQPQGPNAAINSQGVFDKVILDTGFRNADGQYKATQLWARKDLTLGTFSKDIIPVIPGSFIGIELLNPQDSNGNAIFRMSDAMGSILFASNRPFNQVLSGYENVSLSVIVE